MLGEEKRVRIPCEESQLDGRLAIKGRPGAVICHPHPAYGGTMDNNVVVACLSALWDLGFSTLRFNFRTVASASRETDAEVRDVLAALSFFQTATGFSMGDTIVVGYSFGAWVGLNALVECDPPLGWVAVAPPVQMWDFSFVRGLGGYKLIVSGTRDGFCPPFGLEEMFRWLPPPKELFYIEGGDHFFWRMERELASILMRSLKQWI